MKRSVLILSVLAGVGLLAGSSAKAADPATSPAAQYCKASGGKVIERKPVYGTNGDPSTWLHLAGERHFCQFTAKDGSSIHITLETLYTRKPTLAAAAYYQKPPMNPPGPGNPASYYCSQLGGSDLFGGVNAAGGGWVAHNSANKVLEACIFPDMSSIDSWGLTYNTAGIIRGIDLTKVLRYHPK